MFVPRLYLYSIDSYQQKLESDPWMTLDDLAEVTDQNLHFYLYMWPQTT